jgi:hypothetical protein
MPFDEGPRRKCGGDGGGGDNTGDIAAVLYFLRGAAEAGDLYNTYTGREAFDAMARLIDWDPEALWAKLRATE